jgi:hypothetical protein
MNAPEKADDRQTIAYKIALGTGLHRKILQQRAQPQALREEQVRIHPACKHGKGCSESTAESQQDRLGVARDGRCSNSAR